MSNEVISNHVDADEEASSFLGKRRRGVIKACINESSNVVVNDEDLYSEDIEDCINERILLKIDLTPACKGTPKTAQQSSQECLDGKEAKEDSKPAKEQKANGSKCPDGKDSNNSSVIGDNVLADSEQNKAEDESVTVIFSNGVQKQPLAPRAVGDGDKKHRLPLLTLGVAKHLPVFAKANPVGKIPRLHEQKAGGGVEKEKRGAETRSKATRNGTSHQDRERSFLSGVSSKQADWKHEKENDSSIIYEEIDRLKESLKEGEKRLRAEAEFGTEAVRQISDMNEMINQLQKKLENGCHCRTEIRKYNHAKKYMYADVQNKKNQIASLQYHLEGAKRSLNEVEMENKELKSKINHLNADVKSLRSLKSLLETRLAAEGSSFFDYNSKGSKKKASDDNANALRSRLDFSTTGTFIDALKRRQSLLLEHLDQEMSSSELLRTELNRQEQKVQKLNLERKTSQKEVESLRTQMSQLKKERQSLHQEFEFLKAKLEEKEEEIENVKKSYEMKMKKVLCLQSRSDLDNKALQENLRLLREEMSELKDEISVKELQLSNSENCITELQSSLKTFQCCPTYPYYYKT